MNVDLLYKINQVESKLLDNVYLIVCGEKLLYQEHTYRSWVHASLTNDNYCFIRYGDKINGVVIWSEWEHYER